MTSPGTVRWWSWAAAITILLGSMVVSPTSRADVSLQASLDYAILAEPYNNSVSLNMTGNLDTGLAVDRDESSPYYGTIYALRGYTSQTSFFGLQRSVDGGRTFEAPSPVDLCSPFGNQTCDVERPGIAVGTRGTVYIVDPNFASGAVAVLRSADRGRSWQTMTSFVAFGGLASIATDVATGATYLGAVNATGVVLLTKSTDQGVTWSPPVPLATNATETTPAMAALSSNVTFVFLTMGSGSCGIGSCGSVSALASNDGGESWPHRADISPPDVSSASLPSVTVSPMGVFAVSWNSIVAPGAEATFVSISQDQGATFSPPIEVSRYRGIYELEVGGTLAFDGSSRLYVAWQSFGNASSVGTNGTSLGSSIFVGISSNLGQDFTNASFSVSRQGGGANGSSYEHLAAGPDDHVYLTWFDFFGGGGALFRSVAGEASGDVTPAAPIGPGTSVSVELVDPATGSVLTQAPWTGSSLRFAELSPNTYEVRIRVVNASAVAGSMPVRTWNTTTFTVHVETIASGPGPGPFPWTTVAVIGAVVVFATAALLVFQHTRLAREDVLQRKVRLLLYEGIRTHPGRSFTEVRNALGLRNGVAAYHLRVLEKQGLIHTEKGRLHRWYYPNGDVSLWHDLPLSPLQQSLVDQIRLAPGIGIRELARTVNRHHASVAYNVKGLVRDGVLRTQREGRRVQCFPADESGLA